MIIKNCELTQTDQQLIDLAFAEDLGLPYQDVTTQTLFLSNHHSSQAKIISKQNTPIVLCGLFLVKALLKKFSSDCQFYSDYQDGQIIKTGEVILTLSGPTTNLLMVERILLNFLQRLSAIATMTAQFVNAIKHTNTKILDTRKTIPGFRRLEKYAVQCGGGINHRMGLYDAIMIKDTHIDFLGGIQNALDRLPDPILQTCPVIVEVRNLTELDIVLERAKHKVTRILLDNMSLDLLSQSVQKCKNKIATEASGNIHLNNVASVAECGVDYISTGKITHSAGNVDLSMQCII